MKKLNRFSFVLTMFFCLLNMTLNLNARQCTLDGNDAGYCNMLAEKDAEGNIISVRLECEEELKPNPLTHEFPTNIVRCTIAILD